MLEGADGVSTVAAGIAGGTIYSATFTPDGRSVAFESGAGTSRFGNDVVVASSDGVVTRVVDEAAAPTFAPDGRSLAYIAEVAGDSRRSDVGQLALTTLTAGGARLLGPAIAARPAFSPSGRLLAYFCLRGGGVCIRDLRAGHIDVLPKRSAFPLVASAYLSWSPNGRWLAISTASDFNLGLVVYDRMLRAFRRISGTYWLNEVAAPLAWSPDSSTLLWGYRYNRTRVFESNVVTGRRSRISSNDRLWYLARWSRQAITYLTYSGEYQPSY